MGGVYYASANEGTSAIYAFERSKMLLGEPATMVRQEIPGLAGFGFNSITPVDVDGQLTAPDATPGMFIRHRDDELHNAGSNNAEKDYLEIWTLQPDFTNPENTLVEGPLNIEITEFNSDFTCQGPGFGCLTQPESSFTLDPLRETVMYKGQYRRFGGHESVIGNFITNGGDDIAAVRWFEIRRISGGDWALYDEGSYSENDGNSRYMGGSAMDKAGNVVVAYMVTGASKSLSLAYNGRLANDPAGVLTFGEQTLINGTDTIESDRNGDYSQMGVDPVDDCTFWFTSQYAKGNGLWGTRVSNFTVQSCIDPNPGFTLTAANLSQQICAMGDTTPITVSASAYNSFDDNINLTIGELPEGFSASLSANDINVAETSDITFSIAQGSAVGNYLIDINGSSEGALAKSLTANINLFTSIETAILSSPVNGDENMSLTPQLSWAGGNAATYLVEIASDASFNTIIVSTEVSGASYRLSTPLTQNQRYYWRVTGTNVCGSQASSVFSFTTLDDRDSSTELVRDINSASFSADTDERLYFYIDIPANTTGLEFVLSADNGDADLIITKDQKAGPGVEQLCISESFSSNESCHIEGDVQGLYFATVLAFRAYTQATITASFNDPALSIAGQSDLTMVEDSSLLIVQDNLAISDSNNGTAYTLMLHSGDNYDFSDNMVTPDNEFSGTLNVNVSVTDGSNTSDIYALVITVTPVNDAPIITSTNTINISEDSTYTVTSADISVTDVDNSYPQDFTISLAGAEHYSVNGLTITPDSDYFGPLSVAVTVNDGALDSEGATLTINVAPVNDAPMISDSNNISIDEDQTYTVTSADISVVDVDNNYPSDFAINLSDGDHYSIDGLILTPENNYYGPLLVAVTVNDGALDSNSIVLNITVNSVNDAPVITDAFSVTVDEDASYLLSLTDLMLIDDSDVSLLTMQLSEGENYSVSDDSTIIVDANFNGQLSIEATVNDGELDSNTALVTVTVDPVNDAPVANADSIAVVQASANNIIDVLSNDSDIDLDDVLTITSVQQPGNGSAAIVAGKVNYTATQDFVGTDSFVYFITDLTGDSASATVSVRVTAKPVIKSSSSGGSFSVFSSLMLLPLLFIRRRKLSVNKGCYS